MRIWLAEGTPNEWFGALQEGPQILLQLDVEAKPDWEVELRGEDIHVDGARGGELGEDEIGPLRRLDAFPEWVAEAGTKLGIQFSVDDAAINCGRHRSARSKLRAWLGGEER